MERSDKKDQWDKKITKVKTFTIPFALEESKESISISTNTPTKPSKEEIINQAIKFHLEGNISEAIKYYQYCLNQGFNDHRIFCNYGAILKDHGKLKEAELSLRKAININPNFADSHLNLGSILRKLGKLKEAELSTLQAIKLNPNFINAHSNLGGILRNLGKPKEAELSLRKAININPNFADAHLNLGSVLKDLGRLQEAELSLKKAIEINPNFAIPHSNLGIILRDLGKFKQAELSLRKAIEINPNFADTHLNMGNVLKDLGRLKEAELSLRKAIEINPNFAIAHTYLGIILKDLGRLKEAELSLKKAIEINPNFEDSKHTMGSILGDLGKLKELILLLKSMVDSNSFNEGYKIIALVRITISNLLIGDFSKTFRYINITKKFIKEVGIDTIKNEKDKKYSLAYIQLISSLYPKLKKEDKNREKKRIPHIGESHSLSFAHQTLSISSQLKKIQPVLITGGKAWHFANKKNNLWKDSLTQQIKNHTYSDRIFISFGEIDCRKDEGILTYSIKNNKNISEVCKKTIKGYLDYMEETLSSNYSKRYYFGIPAPKRKNELLDELDIKRIKLIKIYNLLLKKEVLSRSSYFLDVYELTSKQNGENNNIHMCDNCHLSPKCLSILFKNHLYKPKTFF
tara:strand:+ start:3649 stop:5547 length:1899 start_codon:yes stop_codon:yes gene_type:complete